MLGVVRGVDILRVHGVGEREDGLQVRLLELHVELNAVKRAGGLFADAAGKPDLVRREWLAFVAACLFEHQEAEGAFAGTQGHQTQSLNHAEKERFPFAV